MASSIPSSGGAPAGAFRTTRWTRVLAARDDPQGAGEALRQLCADYYEPVLVFIRRGGADPDRARDLAHSFFEWLLRQNRLGTLERGRGRFRSYLLGMVKHFLAHQYARDRRQVRGGGISRVPLDAGGTETSPGMELPDVTAPAPDRCFDRQWAITVLDRALARVEEECAEEGGGERFDLLRPWLTGDVEHGDQAALADTLGLPANTLKSLIHRLRRRFRQAVKSEIARTLEDETLVEEEMSALLAALRRPA